MKAYDVIIVIKASLTEEVSNSHLDLYKDTIEKNEGKVLNINNLGKQTIYNGFNKARKGLFIQSTFFGTNVTLEKLQHMFKITEDIMRSTIVKADSVFTKEELTNVYQEAGIAQNA